MTFLRFIAWLIWLQNRSLHRGVILMRLMSFYPEIHTVLRNVEREIDAEEYDSAENMIDYIRGKYGEFSELAGLQARLNVMEMLHGD